MTRRLTRIALVIFAILTGLVLILPVFVVVPMAFNDSQYLTFPPEGWSTRWFSSFFSDVLWTNSAIVSLRVALLSTALSVVLGTLAAFGIARSRSRLTSLVSGLVLAPLIVPYVITGLAFYSFFLQIGLTATTLGFVLAHTALAVPYVTINVTAALLSFDERLELASMSLGASPLTTFFTVTLPVVSPSVAAGALFAFITSWDEVVVSQFLAGPGLTTMPVKLWAGIRVQIEPTVAAVSTMMLLVTIGLFAASGLAALLRRRRRPRTTRQEAPL